MPDPDFIKCVCRHCGGHIEFPAAAAGQSVNCPHCGQTTELAASTGGEGAPRGARHGRGPVLGAVLGLLVLAVAGALLWWRSPARNAVFPPASLPATPSNSPAVSAVSPQPRASAETNDFAIMPYKLEPIPGSSLVYVTGAVSNLSDRQRFGVKLVFSLFDTNGEPAGTATDYQSLMEPRSQWRFKAMVMASKTASARFSSIAEEK